MRIPTPVRLSSEPLLEWRVLTAATGNAFQPTAQATLDHLLRLPVNWPRLLDMVDRHCVIPAFRRGLEPHLGRLPDHVAQDLDKRVGLNRARNECLLGELARVDRLLRSEAIEILPYKGPEMAIRCYGDLALRQFKDLDFLIRPEDFPRVCSVLEADGYSSEIPIRVSLQEHRMRHFKGWSFLRRDLPGSDRFIPDLRPRNHPKYQAIILEPHWAITARRFHLPLDYEALWRRSRMNEVGGTPLLELADEDLLLTVCVNACKSAYPRLQLVADIAAAMHAFDATAWQAALERAYQIDAQRMLLLSTRLAELLLAAPMPAPLRAAESDDPGVARLTSLAVSRLRRSPDRFPTDRFTAFDWLTFFMWEKHRNKLRYLYESTTEPKHWHLTHLPLPRPLHGLYRPMVPLMNSARLLRRFARTRFAQERTEQTEST